jgi:DNA helicase-2/ATP-dependent DNA helicase PcrA
MRSALADPAKRTFEAADAPAPAPGGIAARALAARAGAGGYLDDLNPEQREAVETLDGPVLVLAGAGTGKTRVLTTRIAHILATGRSRPSEILAVTFTNKAAREMKERVGTMVGQAVEGMPWLGTFHAIGVKILRRHAELVGLKNDFTILDVDDQIRLLKQLLEAEHIDEKRWPARVLAGLIDHWKNRGLTPDQVPAGRSRRIRQRTRQETLSGVPGAAEGPQRRRLRRPAAGVHPAVSRERRGARAVSAPLQVHSGGRVSGHQRRAISVAAADRAAGGAASAIGRRRPTLRPTGCDLGPPKNICCVGDDDQSIYGWRGAEVDNILRFDHDFPGAKVIRLERNYRSTGHILAAASHLIAHNEGRLGKTLRTEDVPGEKVQRHRLLGLRGRGALDRRGDRRAAARRPPARRNRDSGAAPRSRCASSKTASSPSACPIG